MSFNIVSLSDYRQGVLFPMTYTGVESNRSRLGEHVSSWTDCVSTAGRRRNNSWARILTEIPRLVNCAHVSGFVLFLFSLCAYLCKFSEFDG